MKGRRLDTGTHCRCLVLNMHGMACSSLILVEHARGFLHTLSRDVGLLRQGLIALLDLVNKCRNRVDLLTGSHHAHTWGLVLVR